MSTVIRCHGQRRMGRHAAPRQAWGWPVEALTVGAVHVIVGRRMPAPAPEGQPGRHHPASERHAAREFALAA